MLRGLPLLGDRAQPLRVFPLVDGKRVLVFCARNFCTSATSFNRAQGCAVAGDGGVGRSAATTSVTRGHLDALAAHTRAHTLTCTPTHSYTHPYPRAPPLAR